MLQRPNLKGRSREDAALQAQCRAGILAASGSIPGSARSFPNREKILLRLRCWRLRGARSAPSALPRGSGLCRPGWAPKVRRWTDSRGPCIKVPGGPEKLWPRREVRLKPPRAFWSPRGSGLGGLGFVLVFNLGVGGWREGTVYQPQTATARNPQSSTLVGVSSDKPGTLLSAAGLGPQRLSQGSCCTPPPLPRSLPGARR